MSGRDKVHNIHAAKENDAIWGYVAHNYNRCGWIKLSKAKTVFPNAPSHRCSESNQVYGDTFASLINSNFCNCGWPVLVKNDDTPMLWNITRPNSLRGADLMKDAVLNEGDRVHWRYVTADGKWVAVWANVITKGKKGSKWGFVRLTDLKRRGDISVHGDGLCRGVAPHVPHGIHDPIDERWPLVCTENDQPNPNADW